MHFTNLINNHRGRRLTSLSAAAAAASGSLLCDACKEEPTERSVTRRTGDDSLLQLCPPPESAPEQAPEQPLNQQGGGGKPDLVDCDNDNPLLAGSGGADSGAAVNGEHRGAQVGRENGSNDEAEDDDDGGEEVAIPIAPRLFGRDVELFDLLRYYESLRPKGLLDSAGPETTSSDNLAGGNGGNGNGAVNSSMASAAASVSAGVASGAIACPGSPQKSVRVIACPGSPQRSVKGSVCPGSPQRSVRGSVGVSVGAGSNKKKHLTPLVVNIHGPSGCGKTALVEEFGWRIEMAAHRRQHEQEQLGSGDEQQLVGDASESMAFGGGVSAAFTAAMNGENGANGGINGGNPNIGFISGKVDALQRHIPYAVIVQALQDLGRRLCELKQRRREERRFRRAMAHREEDNSDAESENTASGNDNIHGNTNADGSMNDGSETESCYRPMRRPSAISYQASREGLHKIKQLLQNEAKVLTHLVPSLMEFVNDDHHHHHNSSDDASVSTQHTNAAGSFPLAAMAARQEIDDGAASERVVCLALVSFLRVVVKLFYPLVWFVDDLQWADAPSVRLLKTLVQDDQLGYLMIVFGFRDDAIMEHQTAMRTSGNGNDGVCTGARADSSRALVQLQRSGSGLLPADFLDAVVPPRRKVNLPLANLPEDVITEWISHLLTSPAETVAPLSAHVHSKTSGNPYFVLQYLELLQRKKLLTYSFNNRKWDWNLPAILNPPENLAGVTGPAPHHRGDMVKKALAEEESVTEVVKIQLASMPLFVQQMLQVASCLGFFFDEFLLKNLLQTCDSLLLLGFSHAAALRHMNYEEDDPERIDDWNPQDDEEECSENADAMFLEALFRAEQEGLIQETNDERIYRFRHDRVREAVYESMAHGKELDLLHLRIGKHIMELEEIDDDRYIMEAVDQLNRGSSLLIHEQERLEVIELNLKASSHARLRAGVNLTADYLEQATVLVKADRDWERSYDLVLEVFSRSAEAEYVRGNYEKSQQRAETILARAKNFDDTIRARYVRLQALGSQRRFKDAVREARRFLTQLGERIPSSSSISVMLEYQKTRRLVKPFTDRDLLNLPPCTDTRKQWIIKVVKDSAGFGWNCDPNFCALMYLRLMRATLKHGSTEQTPCGFAGYGLMVCGFGNEAEGARFGELALKLNKDVSTYAPTVVAVYSSLGHIRGPFVSGVEPLLSAYRLAISSGDLFWGPIALCVYSMLYVVCGLPLAPFASDMRNYGSQLLFCGQDLSVAYILPMLRFAMNMRDETDDPSSLTWEACQSVLVGSGNLELDEKSTSSIYLHYMQMFNAYILGDMEISKQAAKDANFARVPGATHHSNIFHTFLDGLVQMSLYRESKSSKYMKTASRMIKFLADLEEKNVANVDGMLKFLKAEKASLKTGADHEGVKFQYVQAIAYFLDNGLTHFAAIASERAGEYVFKNSGNQKSRQGQHFLVHSAILYNEWGAVAKARMMADKYPFVAASAPSFSRRKSSIVVRKKFDELSEELTLLQSSMFWA